MPVRDERTWVRFKAGWDEFIMGGGGVLKWLGGGPLNAIWGGGGILAPATGCCMLSGGGGTDNETWPAGPVNAEARFAPGGNTKLCPGLGTFDTGLGPLVIWL